MSTDEEKEPPPYIPVEAPGNGTHIYHIPLPPPPPPPPRAPIPQVRNTPVYINQGQGLESGIHQRNSVSYDATLGNSPGMAICTSCQQQVMTDVTYKAGTFAWKMFALFFFLGLTMCLLPFILFVFWKKTKDVYHTCPLCNRVLHMNKRGCCI
ncbi:cell death-inducing p53-target protein 1-like [Scomber scombrus]|uniref:Cell death-inducing p53-target protein 1-like n=2 Tax=Scomber scombrus TaxID=13677 RepID=A0AAV1NVQ4_SCOSC|nr:cell death-inducing p53-target protein 1-like [Scomber scombrus]